MKLAFLTYSKYCQSKFLFLTGFVLCFLSCNQNYKVAERQKQAAVQPDVIILTINASKVKLTIDAEASEQKNIWLDLNNNGKKDTGEAVTNFGNTSEKSCEYATASSSIKIHGKIKYLNCSRNGITDIKAESVKTLTKLVCNGNKLKKLDLKGFPNLSMLSCIENGIEEINLHSNSALSELWCYKNNLKTLQIKGFPKLTLISCYGNSISHLCIEDCPEMQLLDCSENKITNIEAGGCKKLSKLILAKNQITNLDISHFPLLTYLDCSVNNINKEEMEKITSKLPSCDEDACAKFYVIESLHTDEKNVCTKSQVKQAQLKNWTVYDWTGDDGAPDEYEGV